MTKLLLVSAILLTSLMGFHFTNSHKNVVTKDWQQLLDDDHDKYWDVYIGAPHATVKDLDGVDPKSDGKNSKALGLNNDPKNVFSFEKDGKETVLHISGEIYGALSSKNEYENYHLKLQYKWGDRKWEPRLQRERDSGLLYHCVGPHGAFWNVWMQSQEMQVQEGDCGDYYALAKTLMDIPAVKGEDGKEFDYQKGAEMQPFSSVTRLPPGHCNKGFDNEKPHGKWNTVELICMGDTSLHIVNGKVVMALFNSKYQNPEKEIAPLTRGKIQIQSEGAEIFYKKIEVRSIDAIPGKYINQFQ